MGKRKSSGSSATTKPSGAFSSAAAASVALQQSHASELAALSAFDDSPSADFFAAVSQVVDVHRLRVIDTHTSAVTVEIPAPQGTSVKCVTWGSISEDLPTVEVAKRKKKRKNTVKVVAMGLSNGDVALCSPSEGVILRTLTGAHTAAVSDFRLFDDGVHGLSAGLDGYIVRWNVRTGEQTSKFRADTKPIRRIRISHDGALLLSAGHQIKLWEIATWTCLQTYTGHASPILQIAFTPDNQSCVSIAEQDRSVCVWSTGESPSPTNSSVLSVDAYPTNLAISPEGHVLVVTEDGQVCIWKSALAESSSSLTGSSKKRSKFASRTPNGKLSILSSTVDAVVADDGSDSLAGRIPVMIAAFALDKILTGRGNMIKPVFERLPYIDESGLILDNVSVSRAPSSVLAKASDQSAGASKKQPAKATIIGSTDFALRDVGASNDGNKLADASLADRLKSMDLAKEETGSSSFLATPQDASGGTLGGLVTTTGTANQSMLTVNTRQNRSRTKAPSASSLAQLLAQAVQSGDQQLLEQALNVSESAVIYATVRRMPVTLVVPLLDILVVRLQRSPNRASQIVDWVRAVVMVHASFLVSSSRTGGSAGVGELPKQLGALYQTIDARVGVYQKLLKLAGRLDLVVEQIHARSVGKTADTEDEDNVAVYDEADDEDDSEVDEDDMDEDIDDEPLTGDEDGDADELDDEAEEDNDLDDDQE